MGYSKTMVAVYIVGDVDFLFIYVFGVVVAESKAGIHVFLHPN